MGWFSKNDNTSTQFGSPTQNLSQTNGMSMDNGILGMQAAQNPMMQQMANDPITATARLLELNDPVAQFIVSQNIGLLMDLVGEVVRLSIKEFFTSITFTQAEDGKITLDQSSLPASINTLSPENLGLTMTKLQSSAQQTLANNANQRQMFLQAHNMGMSMNPQTQPGFFGALLGNVLGNQVQQQGGFGQTAAKVGMGAAVL